MSVVTSCDRRKSLEAKNVFLQPTQMKKDRVGAELRSKRGNQSGSELRMTPLLVVTGFVGLTETVLGLALTKTIGNIQWVLVIFAIAFPCVIAAVFFLFLWKRNWVFFSPWEFASGDPASFVEAMRGRALEGDRLLQDVRHAMSSVLASGETISKLSMSTPGGGGPQDRERVAKILESITETAMRTIEQSAFLTVDSTPFVGESGRVSQFPYDARRPVAEFLSDVYFSLLDKIVPPFTYSALWILKDSESGTVFNDVGKTWAVRKGWRNDDRPLSEVGIRPGMKLQIHRA